VSSDCGATDGFGFFGFAGFGAGAALVFAPFFCGPSGFNSA
jgi:hypothetical protein